MKLGGADGDRVYATVGRAVGRWAHGSFEAHGTLPKPPGAEAWMDRRPTQWLLGHLTGHVTRANVWPIAGDRLLATLGGRTFRSTDGGRSWSHVHNLPGSSGPMGVLPTSVAVHEGRTYLAEYPLDGETAAVLVSNDGRTWREFVSRDDVRHFHGVFSDPYGGSLWATTGDADDECAIGTLDDGDFRPVGGGSQRWRAVGLVFTPDAVLWGMDCSFAPSIEILRLSRRSIRAGDPNPEVVGVVDNPVFYAESIEDGREVWAVFSTAATTGRDVVSPDDRRGSTGTRRVSVVAASSRTGFDRWHTIADFERAATLGGRLPGLPASNAYAFLATHPDRGLLVNPYNTRSRHGEVIAFDPTTFDSSAAVGGNRPGGVVGRGQ